MEGIESVTNVIRFAVFIIVGAAVLGLAGIAGYIVLARRSRLKGE